ncbi:MAG: DUF2490 domain-containing protein [Bacteroidales bacterium]
MRRFRYSIVVLLVLLAFSYVGESQTKRGLWMGVDLSKPLTKSLSVNISPELRCENSPFRMQDFILEASFRLKLISWVQFEGGYRYSRFYEKDFDDRFNDSRYFAGIRSKIDFGRFSLVNRGHNQRSLIYWYEDGYSVEVMDNLRNRVHLNYNIPRTKLEPFIQGELYYDISSGKQSEFNRIRLRAGASYPLNKRGQVEVFWQYQEKLNANNLEDSYVLGVFYSYKFKRSKQSEMNDNDSLEADGQ